MSRVDRIEIQRIEDAPLSRPLQLAWDPGVTRRTDSFTVVRVFDDEGRMGVGSGGLGKPLRAASAELVGVEVADAADVTGRVGGVFGLDVALADLLGQLHGLPLAQLWGGRGDRVRAYAATVELGTPAQRAEDALGFAAEGFTGLKLRLHNRTIAEDLALATAVREAVGDRLVLMADANQGRAAQRDTEVRWSYQRSLDTAQALEELGFAWLEEPRPLDRLDELAQLRDTVGIAIAGGERHGAVADFESIVAAGAYDIVQPDGVVVGTVAALGAIAALATAAGRPCVFHHGGGGIAAYAHLHLAAAVPDTPWFEVIRDRPGEIPWPAQRAPLVPLGIDDHGDVVVPDSPGLGIALDDEFLDRYTGKRTVVSA